MIEVTHPRSVYVGTAGWSIPRTYSGNFPELGSHLERYAQVFSGVEINSTFYRSHKPATYERWAGSVPPSFRFALKVPRTITHTRRLKNSHSEISSFFAECRCLGPNLGPLLVQLPPSLRFDHAVASAFFDSVRSSFEGFIACEPRHPSWFTDEPNSLMADFNVARVAADPAIVPEAANPGGAHGLVYYRLHGSPRIYYSPYSKEYLQSITEKLSAARVEGKTVWCVFDNTAEGAATGDALAVHEKLST